MPTGGTVTIAVRDLTLTDSDRHDPDPRVGRFVRISVSDTGIGMDEATKARIFDPFYTTKDRGKGTGLGLSNVSRIVAQSGGRLVVETELGKGSTFHVDLPLVGAVPLPTPRRGGAAAQRLRSGVVLVVDDDPDVREFARRSLEAVGFTVLPAAGAEEALSVVERSADRVDVLLTDVVMPRVGGPELAALIRAEWPDVGVVFMSGAAEDVIREGGALARTWDFLSKPFSGEALIEAVDRAHHASVRERASK
jgi:CheY-like chemotaxis protein